MIFEKNNELIELQYYSKNSGYIKFTNKDKSEKPRLYTFKDVSMLEIEQKILNDGYKVIKHE